MKTTTRKELLTTEEAASYLTISIWSLRNRRYSGGGPPFVRLGRQIRYDRQSLDRWLAEVEVQR